MSLMDRASLPFAIRPEPPKERLPKRCAIHKLFRSRDVAAVVGREKHDGLGNLLGLAIAATDVTVFYHTSAGVQCRTLEEAMFTATANLILRSTVTESFPRPRWFDVSMWGRPLDTCMLDLRFREKFQDAIAVLISDQERAGLDILTHGDFHGG